MDLAKQLEILKRGVVEIISEQELLEKLKRFKPLNIKLGVDPTSPDVHLGFTVVMRKLRQFQDMGHQVILIVGDYTATVGDPSGRNKTRPLLSHEQVMENAKSYQEQFFKVVDPKRTRVVYNGEWFSKLTFDQILALMSQITVAQMLEREDFQNRYSSGQPIGLHEFLYPLMQGYDSVKIEADVEIGGTDQKFNVLRGRELQKADGQEPQVGLFLPILIGTDGKEKMSKSLGNYVGISESPQAMYHKLFTLPDHLVESYFELLTDIPLNEYQELIEKSRKGEIHPNEVKEKLALVIVTQYHGTEEAKKAAREEKKVHTGSAIPSDVEQKEFPKGEYWLPGLMTELKLSQSNGEARRLIQNGGVSFDNEKITDPKAEVVVENLHILKCGKRKFLQIKAV